MTRQGATAHPASPQSRLLPARFEPRTCPGKTTLSAYTDPETSASIRAIAMATIALVDDDKNILASVTMLLEQEGYHVRSYSDGASALTALSANPPDLAVLDIK